MIYVDLSFFRLIVQFVKKRLICMQNYQKQIRVFVNLLCILFAFDVVLAHGGEGLDEGFGQTDIGVFRK